MNAIEIEGCNARPGQPSNWNTERDGPCGALPVRAIPHANGLGIERCESAWKPDAADLSCLNHGGHIILSVFGWQVPVSLTVEAAYDVKQRERLQTEAEEIAGLKRLVAKLGAAVTDVSDQVDTSDSDRYYLGSMNHVYLLQEATNLFSAYSLNGTLPCS